MSDGIISACQLAASVLSIVLMGAVGVMLLIRLVRVAAGREAADGLSELHEGKTRPVFWRGMVCAGAAALLSRILVYFIAFGIMRLFYAESEGLLAALDDLWLHWDTRHYIGIAENGYTAVGDERLRLVFFPMFPLLMRIFSVFTGGNLFFGGLLVSLLCTCISAALVYDLGMMHGDARTAALCVAYFLLSPMSVFLNCAYTEALFICLTLGTVCLLRRGRPWLAAVLGGASALTRMPGVIIAGLFIIALIEKIAKKRFGLREVLSCAGQVLIVFSGLLLYLMINWIVTGDPLMYLTYQRENWFQKAGSFWQTASTTVYYTLAYIGADDWFFCWLTQLSAMFAMFALLVWKGKHLPFDLAAYSFVYVAVVLSPTWLLSGPRYLYALCALPLLKAKLTEDRRIHGALLSISALLLVVYTYGYALAVEVL